MTEATFVLKEMRHILLQRLRDFIRRIDKTVLSIAALLMMAFVLRFYAATTAPLVEDEGVKILLSDRISINPRVLNIPAGDAGVEHSLLSIYIVKTAFFLFGKSVLSGRIFFVLLGTLSLCFIYKLAAEQLGKNVGTLTLVLLVFDQFHVGESSQIREEAPLLFFSAVAVYSFFKSIRTNKMWIYWTAISLGLGYLCKEIVLAVLLAFVIFFLIKKEYRLQFGLKQVLTAGFLMLIVVFPYLLWGIRNNFCNYNVKHLSLGFSLRPVYLYFGEIFIWLSGLGVFALPTEISPEFPLVHWISGTLIFLSIFYSLKTDGWRNEFVLFCLLLFCIIFVLTAIIDPALFDSHWRASLTIYPGFILSANMLVNLGYKNRYCKLVLMILIIYLIVHLFYFITFPVVYGYNHYVEKAEIYLANDR